MKLKLERWAEHTMNTLYRSSLSTLQNCIRIKSSCFICHGAARKSGICTIMSLPCVGRCKPISMGALLSMLVDVAVEQKPGSALITGTSRTSDTQTREQIQTDGSCCTYHCHYWDMIADLFDQAAWQQECSLSASNIQTSHAHGGRNVALNGLHFSCTYCSPSHIGWMWEMHIVEQEQDRVQSIILFRLALFTSTEDHNSSKINSRRSYSCGQDNRQWCWKLLQMPHYVQA